MKHRTLELRDEAWQEWQDAALYYDLEKPGLGDDFDKAVLAALDHLQRVAAHYQVRQNGFRYAPVLKARCMHERGRSFQSRACGGSFEAVGHRRALC